MITHYKCKKLGCDLRGILVPYTRALRAKDGKGMVCSECGSKLVVAKTKNLTGGPRSGGRGRTSRRS